MLSLVSKHEKSISDVWTPTYGCKVASMWTDQFTKLGKPQNPISYNLNLLDMLENGLLRLDGSGSIVSNWEQIGSFLSAFIVGARIGINIK